MFDYYVAYTWQPKKSFAPSFGSFGIQLEHKIESYDDITLLRNALMKSDPEITKPVILSFRLYD